MDDDLSWLTEINLNESVIPKLKELVANNDFNASNQIFCLMDFINKTNIKIFIKLTTFEGNTDLYTSLYEQNKIKLKSWLQNLKSGDNADSYHIKDRKWYRIKILKRDADEILVHYQGWDSKYDQLINIFTSEILPPGCRAKYKDKAPKQSKGEIEAEIDDISPIIESSSSSSADIDESKLTTDENIILDRPRRSIKIIEDISPVKYSKKKLKSDVPDDDNDWLCGICGMLESNDGSDLLMCDGPCRRSFHYGCLKLSTIESDRVSFYYFIRYFLILTRFID